MMVIISAVMMVIINVVMMVIINVVIMANTINLDSLNTLQAITFTSDCPLLGRQLNTA